MSDDSPKPPFKWTLTVVIVLMILLAGVLLPILWIESVGSDHHRRQALCGRNMSQLMGALAAYSTEAEVAWPSFPAMPKRDVMDAHEARRVTCQMFAALAKQQSLSMRWFTCPQSGKRPPSEPVGSPVPIDWGMSDAGVLSYAFDWASESDPSAYRVILADRDSGAHNGAVFACFGDAHVKKLKHARAPSARGPEALVTEGIDGKPIAVSVVNPEAGADDIFSTEGDGEDPPEPDAKDAKPVPMKDYDPLAPSKGHPRKAWVK